MSLAMSLELRKEFEKLQDRSDLRAVILRGVGENFCVGGDPSGWASEARQSTGMDTADNRRLDVAAAAIFEVVSTCTTLLGNLSVPVLAVLQGEVRGIGLALALAADWRVCTSDARLERENGDLFGLDESLRQVVGPCHASKLAGVMPSTITSTEAVSLGLVSCAYSSVQEAVIAAMSLANEIGSTSAGATRNAMELLRSEVRADSVAEACVSASAKLGPPSIAGLIDAGSDAQSRVTLRDGALRVHLLRTRQKESYSSCSSRRPSWRPRPRHHKHPHLSCTSLLIRTKLA